MSLWTSADIAKVTGGQAQGNWHVNGLSIDSREICEGDLFVALKAARDGHEFVSGALERGASGALVSYVPEGCETAPLVIVDDVEVALCELAKARRVQVNARIVAVTGSAGKTSTKEMLKTVFEGFGKTHASVKSFNNHWGVPLTLARMPRDVEYGVFEIGMNAPGEISPLVKLVRPDVAIITNIAPVHLAGFQDEMGIALEKASIMDGLSDDGVAIVYGDMDHYDIVLAKAHTMLKSFGRRSHNDVKLTDEANGPKGGSGRALGQKFDIHVAGAHHLQNALAVFATADWLNLDIKKVAERLAKWEAPDGRGAMFDLGHNIRIVDESYNANPLSMRAALETFSTFESERKIAVLGAMAELGPESAKFHNALGDIPALQTIDIVHVIGAEMRELHDKLGDNKGQFFESSSEVIMQITELFQHGDMILFKGSNSVGLGKVVDAMKKLSKTTREQTGDS